MTAQPDAYKVLQVDPEAEDEVIVAAYRGSPASTTPTSRRVTRPPRGCRRSTRRSALIGTPAKRATYDRDRRATASGHGPSSTSAHRPPSSGTTTHRTTASPPPPSGTAPGWRTAAPAPPARARDGVARLDLGPVVGRRWLRPVDANQRWDRRGRAATGQSVGQRRDLRSIQRLVARRDRPGGPRVPRMARSHADRPAVSRRDRHDPAADGSAPIGAGRVDGASRSVQAPLSGPLPGQTPALAVTTPRGSGGC